MRVRCLVCVTLPARGWLREARGCLALGGAYINTSINLSFALCRSGTANQTPAPGFADCQIAIAPRPCIGLSVPTYRRRPRAAQYLGTKHHTESRPTQLQPPPFPNPAASPPHLRYSPPSCNKRLLLKYRRSRGSRGTINSHITHMLFV